MLLYTHTYIHTHELSLPAVDYLPLGRASIVAIPAIKAAWPSTVSSNNTRKLDPLIITSHLDASSVALRPDKTSETPVPLVYQQYHLKSLVLFILVYFFNYFKMYLRYTPTALKSF